MKMTRLFRAYPVVTDTRNTRPFSYRKWGAAPTSDDHRWLLHAFRCEVALVVRLFRTVSVTTG